MRSAAPNTTAYGPSARPRRRVLAVSLTLAASLLAAACGGGSSDKASDNTGAGLERSDAGGSTADITLPAKGEIQMGGKVVYGIEAETDSMLPTKARWAIAGQMYANAVFDPIAAYDKDGVPQPYLAQKIEPAADFRSWTLTARPGITFHNGEKLDGEAAKLFVEALVASNLTGPAARPITNVRVAPDDPMTVIIELDTPWVAFPHLMTGQGGLMPAPAQIKAEDGLKPIGTGPFVLKEWVKDNRFVASKNPNYWRKDAQGRQLPYLDEVEFRPLPDTQSRIDSLGAGTVNMLHESQGRSVSKLQADANAGEIQFILGGGEDEERFVLLNTNRAPLDDVRMRRALAHATNLEEYFATTQEDPTLAATSPFNSTGEWYADPGYPQYDLAKATELVNEWKADNGGQTPKIVLETTPNPENDQATQLLQTQWVQAGIDVELKTQDQVTFILGAVTGNYGAALFRQFGALDPDGDFHFWTGKNSLGPEATELRLNFSNLKDAELDAALDKGRSTEDVAVRKEAYATVAKRMADQVPYVWLQHVRWSIAADNTVRDFLNGPLPDGQEPLPVNAGVHRLTHAWIEN